ncbi:MAG: hypothetical protein ACREU3_04970 [Steroidobacteraceae bacterium]
MSKPLKERACVLRLLARLGRPMISVECLEPPAPDVRVRYEDGSLEVFEVTEIHPDESPHQGSPARGQEERRARRDPHAIVPTCVPAEALPAICRRVEEKRKRADIYAVQPYETLSLLLVGSLPLIGAVASTYVFAPFLTIDRLNAELNESLGASRFQRAYLHLPLSGNSAWGWTSTTGWRVLCAPENIGIDGRKTLEALKGLGSGVVPPGTQIFGWPR